MSYKAVRPYLLSIKAGSELALCKASFLRLMLIFEVDGEDAHEVCVFYHIITSRRFHFTADELQE